MVTNIYIKDIKLLEKILGFDYKNYGYLEMFSFRNKFFMLNV